MCRTGKIPYGSMRDAVKAADATNRRRSKREIRGKRPMAGGEVRAYICPYCHGFHVGRKPLQPPT